MPTVDQLCDRGGPWRALIACRVTGRLQSAPPAERRFAATAGGGGRNPQTRLPGAWESAPPGEAGERPRGGFSRRTLLAVVFLIAASLIPSVHAHPVAQGAMEFRFEPGRLVVQARVSPEEVLVALASGKPEPGTTADAWGAHGRYLVDHLKVSVDDRLLTGTVSGVQPPTDASSQARAVYTLEYPLTGSAAPPTRLKVEQDVLREFSYAPGNPWTASYVAQVDPPGGAAPTAGLLLAREQPLEFSLPPPPTSAAAPGPAEISHGRIVREYITHGLWHILTGYDHMLFMGALVLAARTLWDLIKVVSVFTLAHTLTLTLSVLDVVRLPERVVEPMIAASIVFVAVQNVLFPVRAQGWTRLGAAFGFGLFHGLGFAGGLLEAMNGLPGLAVGTAIAAFSVGVELGHQAVVLPVFGGLKLLECFRARLGPAAVGALRRRVELAGSVGVALAGAAYLFLALRGG